MKKILAACAAMFTVSVAQAQEDSSIPVMEMYLLSEAGKMIANQHGMANIYDTVFSSAFCWHTADDQVQKGLWQAVWLHGYSTIAMYDDIRNFELAYAIPAGTFNPADPQAAWEGMLGNTRTYIVGKGEEWANNNKTDVCNYLINWYTTYGKIPVPDLPETYIPLINPE